MGRKEEAIDFTWNNIYLYINKNKDPSYLLPAPIDCRGLLKKNGEESLPNENENVNVFCVKWGTRYDAEYVNKLLRGIKRNTTKKFDFYCFTEDPNGLMAEIQVIPLKENWSGWWGKATLFSDGKFFKRKKKRALF